MKPLRAARDSTKDQRVGRIPDNVVVDETAFLDLFCDFAHYFSEAAVGLRIGRAATCSGMVFDVGPNGKVTLGDYVMAVAARIICDAHVIMEDYSMIAWDAVLMDTFRVPSDPEARRREIEYASTREPRRIGVASLGRPTRVGRGAWIGSGACVLPGVIVGDGSIVGARAVVTSDVPAYTIVAGNPAKVIRRFSRIERDLFTSILGEMDAAI